MDLESNNQLAGTFILIVEDDPLLAFDLTNLLSTAGAEVVGPALSLEDALALAETEPLTCGVLDVRLRDEFVFPVAEVLQKRHVGIVFYTGQHEPGRLRQDWPCAKILAKPATPDLLIRTVETVCRVH